MLIPPEQGLLTLILILYGIDASRIHTTRRRKKMDIQGLKHWG